MKNLKSVIMKNKLHFFLFLFFNKKIRFINGYKNDDYKNDDYKNKVRVIPHISITTTNQKNKKFEIILSKDFYISIKNNKLLYSD